MLEKIYSGNYLLSERVEARWHVVAVVSSSSGPGSSPGWGHCVKFLGKTLNPRDDPA